MIIVRATIKDVAKLAGVSTATISNVLTGKKFVGEETTKKVKQAMGELNYQANTIARSLKVNRTYTIGLMVPDITNPFFGEIVKYTEVVTNKQNYQLTLCSSDNDINKERKIIDTFLAAGVDGIINVAPRMKKNQLNQEIEVPMVIVDRIHFPTDGNLAFVYADNYQGASTVAGHFVKKGYKRFICLAGPVADVPNARQRRDGFLDRLKREGFTEGSWMVSYGDFTFESGYKLMEELLDGYDTGNPMAVFAGNDLMAWGAMEAAKTHRYKIPRDLSVIGYDNIFFSEFLYPKLTTVENPTKEMGTMAARILLEAMSGQERLNGRYTVVNYTFIKRQSD